MKTREKSFLNIKSKLTAAVAMLLVAFFMVISSSYAWFTLSTAPEVTGITTTVGANGNLEIALLKDNPTKTLSELANSVSTGFVGTNPSVTKTNTYWGNLVSLTAPKEEGNEDPYGLNNIKLLPSRLNVEAPATGTTTNQIKVASPLAIPEYVGSGQPSILKNTLGGIYKNEGFTNSGYGVRGIGTQSTMSQQELDWRSASQNYSSAISRAAALTNSAISGNNGQALVNIVVGYAAGDTEFKTHVGTVAAIITALENGLMSNLETAKVEALKAIYAKAGESTETYVSPANVVVTTEKNGDTYTITATVAGNSVDVSTASADTAFKTLCEKTYDIEAALDLAREKLNAISGTSDTVTWEQISAVLNPLFSVTAVEIGGKTYADLKKELADKNKTTTIEAAEYILANCMNADKSFTVSLKEGSGLFADVHKVTGKQVKTTAYYMQIVPVHMQTTVATPSTINMDGLKPTVSNQNASPYLTDLYGYALDFAFRTNAKGSNLLLSEAANRIYSNSTNEETMGHGSVMKFSSSDPAFLAEDVADLMGCLRVVFTDVDGNILAVGAADRDATGKIITTVNGDEVTAKIVLYNYTLSYSADDIDEQGKLTLGDKKEKQAITALNQNQATVISAYVFLDGDATDNTKVGTGTESMTGSINLQFASDAELTPMDYADLKGQTNS